MDHTTYLVTCRHKARGCETVGDVRVEATSAADAKGRAIITFCRRWGFRPGKVTAKVEEVPTDASL